MADVLDWCNTGFSVALEALEKSCGFTQRLGFYALSVW